MKKSIFRLGVVLVVLSLFVTGCGNKKSITGEEFKNKIEKQDKYLLTNAREQFEENDLLVSVYIASDKNYKYQVEFYEFKKEADAKSFVEGNREIFEKEKGNSNNESEVNVANYSKYTLKTNDEYKVLSRIDNTVAYVNAKDKYTDEVQEILKLIGY